MTTALYTFVSATSQVDKVMELANLRNGITDVKVSSVNCTLELPLVIDPLLNNGRNTSIVIKDILGKDYRPGLRPRQALPALLHKSRQA